MDDSDREHLHALLDRADVVAAFLRGCYHDAGLAAELTRLSSEIRRERERLAVAFGEQRGWVYSARSPFSVWKLREGRRAPGSGDPLVDDHDPAVIDRLDHFRERGLAPNGRVAHWPIAIASHTLADRDAIEAYAADVGLHVEVLPSFFDPRYRVAAVFTHPRPDLRPTGGRNPRPPTECSAPRASVRGQGSRARPGAYVESDTGAA